MYYLTFNRIQGSSHFNRNVQQLCRTFVPRKSAESNRRYFELRNMKTSTNLIREQEPQAAKQLCYKPSYKHRDAFEAARKCRGEYLG